MENSIETIHGRRKAHKAISQEHRPILMASLPLALRFRRESGSFYEIVALSVEQMFILEALITHTLEVGGAVTLKWPIGVDAWAVTYLQTILQKHALDFMNIQRSDFKDVSRGTSGGWTIATTCRSLRRRLTGTSSGASTGYDPTELAVAIHEGFQDWWNQQEQEDSENTSEAVASMVADSQNIFEYIKIEKKPSQREPWEFTRVDQATGRTVQIEGPVDATDVAPTEEEDRGPRIITEEEVRETLEKWIEPMTIEVDRLQNDIRAIYRMNPGVAMTFFSESTLEQSSTSLKESSWKKPQESGGRWVP